MVTAPVQQGHHAEIRSMAGHYSISEAEQIQHEPLNPPRSSCLRQRDVALLCPAAA